MPGERSRLVKTAIFTVLVVLSNSLGNLFLGYGMKSAAGIWSPWVAAGVALLIFWTLTRMTLLSWADLTFVLPVTAVGYPFSAWLGKVFLHEEISAGRWIGTALILAGTVLVGVTAPGQETRR